MGRIKYLLDTNILSEPTRKNPNNKVMQYFSEHDGLFVTAAVVWHELQGTSNNHLFTRFLR